MRFWECSFRHATLLRERRIVQNSLPDPLPEQPRENLEISIGVVGGIKGRRRIQGDIGQVSYWKQLFIRTKYSQQ
jgi:hypothetical protein